MKIHGLDINFVCASTEEHNGTVERTIRHHLNFLLNVTDDVILKVWEIDYVKTCLPNIHLNTCNKKRKFGEFKMREYDWESSVYSKVLQCTFLELSDGHVLDIHIGRN